MLPAVTVAVDRAVALRISARLFVDTVAAKGTPGTGSVPSPIFTVAVPLKVTLPFPATEPPVTFPSTMTSRASPRSEVPRSTAWN